jgi:hypothetical protein
MTASRTKDEPLLPLGIKFEARRVISVRGSISKTSANYHKTFDVREGTGSTYACKCVYEDVSVRQSMVRCRINRGEGGRDEEYFRRNEEVSKRRGELSNNKIFLRGWSDVR